MRALLLMMGLSLGLASLSGCSTIVEEKSFIRPDKRSGFTSSEHFDASKLPSATIKEQSITTDNGIVLKGLSALQPGALSTVLYFGGNMFHIDQHATSVLPVMTSCGANVIVFDYRGYGRSQGEPNVANMKSDALKIFDFANAQTPGRVIVHGQSLGSFIAAYVAEQRPALGMVLESTATNPQDWADANMPWYARPFMTIEVSASLREVDNTVAVSKFTGASLVMVGDQDKITPPQLGQKVFAAIPASSKQMLVIAGAGHNGVLEHPDSKAAYCSFIAKRSF